MDSAFYKGKRVFVTGHTGFKGSWLCRVLIGLGAEVTGFSLAPPMEPNLFALADIEKNIGHNVGDIRDFDALKKVFEAARPEIVFHLAAQPIVRDGYKNPRYTYQTNVMGAVNIFECVRLCESVRSVLNVTTDKVYANREWHWGYREDDRLCGFDPYSNSKSCSELVASSYKNSFFRDRGISVSTARAGNVIGGGDFAKDRIIPDCVRAVIKGERIIVRNPHSIRPYQHVLEAITAYMTIAEKQYNRVDYADSYNIGPDDCDCVTTGALADLFCETWGEAVWESKEDGGPHEAQFLKLDCSKIKSTLGWRGKWHIAQAVQKTCEWTKAWIAKENTADIMDTQICSYIH